jgi:hypothetical protein
MKITMLQAPTPPTHSLIALNHGSVEELDPPQRPSKLAASATHPHGNDLFLLRASLIIKWKRCGLHAIEVWQRRVHPIAGAVSGAPHVRTPTVTEDHMWGLLRNQLPQNRSYLRPASGV